MSAITVDTKDLAYQLANIDEDKGPLVLKIEISCSVCATIAVILRLWSRRIVKAPWKSDDYTIIVSLVRPHEIESSNG